MSYKHRKLQKMECRALGEFILESSNCCVSLRLAGFKFTVVCSRFICSHSPNSNKRTFSKNFAAITLPIHITTLFCSILFLPFFVVDCTFSALQVVSFHQNRFYLYLNCVCFFLFRSVFFSLFRQNNSVPL